MNDKCFGGKLPPAKVEWSTRLRIAGNCRPDTREIRLSVRYHTHYPEELEYTLVHEMLHVLERRHNDRFVELMDRFMPQWRLYRDELNRAPLGHEDWKY